MKRLKRGDYVRVKLAGDERKLIAFVGLATDSQPSSAILLFDGALPSSSGGIWCGTLPLIIDYEKETVESLHGDRFEIEVRETGRE